MDSNQKKSEQKTLSQKLSDQFFSFNNNLKSQVNSQRDEEIENLKPQQATPENLMEVEKKIQEQRNLINEQQRISQPFLDIQTQKEPSQNRREKVELMHLNVEEFMKIDKIASEYGLDQEQDLRFINRRLERPPKFKRAAIDMTRYPVQNAENNSIQFLMDELIHERQQVYKYYQNQGFLGKTLLCLLDKMISGSLSSINTIDKLRKKEQVKNIEGARVAPSIMIRDPEIPLQQQRVKILRHLSQKARSVLQEVIKVKQYLQNINPSQNLSAIEYNKASEIKVIDEDLATRLELQSQSVRKLKGRLMQRSISLDANIRVDLKNMNKDDWEMMLKVLEVEYKKVDNMIELFEYNNERIHKKASKLHLALECQKEQNQFNPNLLSQIKQKNTKRQLAYVEKLSQKSNLLQQALQEELDMQKKMCNKHHQSLPTFEVDLAKKKSKRLMEGLSYKTASQDILMSGFNDIINFL
ncbi:UNKNOWN [Stylonychia lemnae]|uniref:Uncharacterized protein n=1 Tax=Stylonychia lemnae TaxID=5949 RepID=A0A078ALE2_STYLE|nr:UNKNOWN [Stylonychia lemnae]|eukprot:CDW81678.1 UNKNOWN [Stylonychia lemnae]